jgi:hypothetical protein
MSLHPACGHQALEKAARDGDPSRIVMSLPNITSKTYSVCVMSNDPMLIELHSRLVILGRTDSYEVWVTYTTVWCYYQLTPICIRYAACCESGIYYCTVKLPREKRLNDSETRTEGTKTLSLRVTAAWFLRLYCIF